MKNLLTITLCFFSLGTFAQMQVDKKIEMTGATPGDKKIEGIEEVVNSHDAANKEYVDTAIANRASSGGSSNMDFNFTASSASVVVAVGYNTSLAPLVVDAEYISGDAAPVSLSISGLPVGVTMKGTRGGFPDFSTSLAFYASNTAVAGTYNLTLTATGGASLKTINLVLDVVDIKRVFVTSTGYQGNLGGASGADSKCQSHANSAALGGTWKAWISTSVEEAKDRMSNFAYIRMDNALVVHNLTDLLDGNLFAPVELTELGTQASGWPVWTGSNEDGTLHANNCNNWSSNSSGVNGRIGSRNSFEDAGWTSIGNYSCNNSFRIYCFEQ